MKRPLSYLSSTEGKAIRGKRGWTGTLTLPSVPRALISFFFSLPASEQASVKKARKSIKEASGEERALSLRADNIFYYVELEVTRTFYPNCNGSAPSVYIDYSRASVRSKCSFSERKIEAIKFVSSRPSSRATETGTPSTLHWWKFKREKGERRKASKWGARTYIVTCCKTRFLLVLIFFNNLLVKSLLLSNLPIYYHSHLLTVSSHQAFHGFSVRKKEVLLPLKE